MKYQVSLGTTLAYAGGSVKSEFAHNEALRSHFASCDGFVEGLAAHLSGNSFGNETCPSDVTRKCFREGQ